MGMETAGAVPQVQEGFAASGEYFRQGMLAPGDVISLEAEFIPEIVSNVPGHESEVVNLSHDNGWQLPKLHAHNEELPDYAGVLAHAREIGAHALIASAEPVQHPIPYDREAVLARVQASAAQRTAAYEASHAAVAQQG